MNRYKNYFLPLAIFFIYACSGSDMNTEMKSNKTNMNLANSWVTAGYTGKSEAIEMVKNNMAEDGVSVGDRYVGFGFIWNPDGDGMVVDYVVPDSPADSVLKEGDAFVEVNGVRLTNDNRNQLGFRGMPGENVNAVILRDGMEMPISFARGPVQVRYSKDQVLSNFESGDAETWGPEEFNVIETAVTDEGVVYVLHWAEFIEDSTGYKANAFTTTRFEFNDEGKVSWVGDLSEDRFVLEQQGWSITR